MHCMATTLACTFFCTLTAYRSIQDSLLQYMATTWTCTYFCTLTFRWAMGSRNRRELNCKGEHW